MAGKKLLLTLLAFFFLARFSSHGLTAAADLIHFLFVYAANEK